MRMTTIILCFIWWVLEWEPWRMSRWVVLVIHLKREKHRYPGMLDRKHVLLMSIKNEQMQSDTDLDWICLTGRIWSQSHCPCLLVVGLPPILATTAWPSTQCSSVTTPSWAPSCLWLRSCQHWSASGWWWSIRPGECHSWYPCYWEEPRCCSSNWCPQVASRKCDRWWAMVKAPVIKLFFQQAHCVFCFF